MSDVSDNDVQNTGLSSIDYHTLNPSAAWLAADEVAYLGPIHDTDDQRKRVELTEWIGGILGENLNPETLFDDLSSGVRLLYLAKSVHLIKCAHLKDSQYADAVRNLQPDEFAFTHGEPLKRASLIAKQRSNIAKFLEWCRDIGVPLVTLFETEDLVYEKNLRQVTSCLFHISRIAFGYGIEPPSSVKDEMKKEEAKLLRKKMEGNGTSSPSLKTKQHGLGEPPTADYKGENCPILPTNGIRDSNFDSGYVSKSPPTQYSGQTSNLESTMKPISPIELKFEGHGPDVVADEIRFHETDLHSDSKHSVNPQDMIIANKLHFRPVDVDVDHETTGLGKGTKVRDCPTVEDPKKYALASFSDSTFDTETTDEDEYHTAQSMILDDASAVTYHVAQVHDVGDNRKMLKDEFKQNDANHKMAEHTAESESTDSLSEEMPDTRDMTVDAPFGHYLVTTETAVENQEEEAESTADESATDVESYALNGVEPEVTFADVGVGTESMYFEKLKKKGSEIMINFPPYFEFISKDEFPRIPPQVYTVAPVANEPIYAVSSKRNTTRNQTHENAAYEAEQQYASGHSRDYSSLEARQPKRQRQQKSSPATLPLPHTRKIFEADAQNVKSTQTHVSLAQDIVRIINDLEDIPAIRTTHSSASSAPGSTPTHSRAGTTIVVRTQYQRTLPACDRDIAVTQFSDLENERPPRWGSVNSSTRHRLRDPEYASSSPNKAVRRSVMRRASSAISEQFEKAVVVAKKYKKQIIIVLVLLILTGGVLAAMLAVFPLT